MAMGIVLIHPQLPFRLATLTDGAYRLYTTALLWSTWQRSKGQLRTEDLDLISFARLRRRYARELVDRGHWRAEPDGWYIVDFDEVIRRGGPRPRIPAGVKQRVLERDGHRCTVCGTTENLSIDHKEPWSRFGSDKESNLQTLCSPCNSRKGTRG